MTYANNHGVAAPSKTRLERRQPPAFDVCIELLSQTRWRIHHDISRAVDSVLRPESQSVDCEIRELVTDAHGNVTVRLSREAFPAVDRVHLALAGAPLMAPQE